MLIDYRPVRRFFPFQTAFLPRILHPNQSWWFCRLVSSHWCIEWHLRHPLGYNTFTVKECTLDFKKLNKTRVPFTLNETSKIAQFQSRCISHWKACLFNSVWWYLHLALKSVAKIEILQNWQIIRLTENFFCQKKIKK